MLDNIGKAGLIVFAILAILAGVAYFFAKLSFEATEEGPTETRPEFTKYYILGGMFYYGVFPIPLGVASWLISGSSAFGWFMTIASWIAGSIIFHIIMERIIKQEVDKGAFNRCARHSWERYPEH